MKQNVCANVLCYSLLACSIAAVIPQAAASGEDINFPDANLEAAVRDHLAIPAPTPITDTDMETLASLFASSRNVSHIQGLRYAMNLATLSLDQNQITNISEITELTDLTTLDLHQNTIADISPLQDLLSLTSLNLALNNISNASAVSRLANLTHLWLNFNQLSDIAPVDELINLTFLGLSHNNISNIEPISELTNLTSFEVSYNQVDSISAVSNLTNLTHLWLIGNEISDISAVSSLPNLQYLLLSRNYVQTMNLSNAVLSSLQYFGIDENPLTTVFLADATLNQTGFNVMMDGGHSTTVGIAELPGVLSLDMSSVDFGPISDLSKMYTMDDLEELLLVGATNIDGTQLSLLPAELDSLAFLDVTGPWNTFDSLTQNSLNAWDAVDGNTLVIPEPTTLALLLIGGSILRKHSAV